MVRKAEELQEDTKDFLNIFGCNVEDEVKFVELMSRSHKTIQQNYTRFVLRWIGKMAMTKYYDARNEASVKLCKKIIDTIGEDNYLPIL